MCLYDAKVRAVKERYENEAQESAQDEEAKEGADEQNSIDMNMRKISLQEEIARIPLNPIPYVKNDSPEVKILNELGLESGRFGWCLVCRNTADLYCKETKHPVCSQECKKKHLAEANALDGMAQEQIPGMHKLDEANLAFTDSILVFRSIVKLSVGGDSDQSPN